MYAEIDWLLAIWGWTVLAVLSALIEHDKRGTFATGFFLGLLLGPLGVLISLLSGGRASTETSPQCPECRAPTSPAYRFCDRCGASLHA
jgi:hypothetical protein